MTAVLATDYDRTLAVDGVPDPNALRSIQALRQSGVLCVLVTGRPPNELQHHGLDDEAFDGYVTEGGCLYGSLAAPVQLAAGLDVEQAFARCMAAGIETTRREHSFSIPRKSYTAALPLLGVCSLQPNVTHVDVLPPGIDKGIGLDGILGSLGQRGATVVAVGDGENDVPMFERATHGLATADAAPELKTVADEVLLKAGPEAVTEVARRMLVGEWRTPGGWAA